VVYKVDRLTRSLTDFARIVDAFDKQGISFVSVTQQFNTTTSMGRLTLNVLLSFAQFEREVTGERIRDKIAASKRKGMWMGGVVPIGYDLQDRHLVINPQEAELVQEIYRRYLKLGCVSKLRAHLDRTGIRSKKRVSKTGGTSGGVVYSRGALYDMLQNPIYLGQIRHKGKSYPGQHAAIIEQELWDKVQARFAANLQAPRRRPRATEKSILMGLLYDGAGNRFVPSHSNKKGKRYRYYVSQAVIKSGRKGSAGPVRLPANEVEEFVLSQLTDLLQSPQRMLDILNNSSSKAVDLQRSMEAIQRSAEDPRDKVQRVLQSVVARIVVHDERVEIAISKYLFRREMLGEDIETPTAASNDEADRLIIHVKARLTRCGGEVRLLLPPDSNQSKPHPVPSLIRAVARAHDWVGRILCGDYLNLRSVANETGLDERYISRIIPLAFLAPDLTEAMLEGTHSAHLSLATCMGNVPVDWVQQRARLGRL
jgi:site-specific DNA recombinase